MRLSLLIIFLFLILFCSLAQGTYTITPDKTFFVGDTIYRFANTTNVTTIGKEGLWFVVDNLHMMAVADNTSVLICINSFNDARVNFTYTANRSCTIFFNCSGNAFTKELFEYQVEMLEVDYKIQASDVDIDTNKSIGDIFTDDGNSAVSTLLTIMPLIIMVAVIMVVVGMFRSF